LRIRLTTDYKSHHPNEVIDVSADVAKQLLSKGLAIQDKSMTATDMRTKGVKRG
jgi:hypothetical protein